MYIVIAILVLGLLILAHEFGHYIVGKKSGIAVLEFAVGMGPKVVSWQRGETQYSIRLIPLGGFCRFLGEDENNSDPRSLTAAPLGKRFMTIFAGALFNIILAFLLAFFLMFGLGDNVPTVAGLLPDSNSAAAGIQEGDIVYSIDGHTLLLPGDLNKYVQENQDGTVDVVVLRNGQKVGMEVEPIVQDGVKLIGVQSSYTVHRFGFFESIGRAVAWCWALVVEIFLFFVGLITGHGVAGGVVGPVGTISVIGSVAQVGFRSLVSLVSMLSINLGVVNLLPLPALDGGRLVFVLIEAIRGKPVPPEKEGMVHLIGMAALMVLIVFLTYQDIVGLFTGSLGG